jgi:hypothetical protein
MTSLSRHSLELVASLVVGVAHAAGLLFVALDLGYAVGPNEYSLVGMAWRYGGLVLVASLPVWLTLRFRLVVPLGALVLTTGYVVGVELLPPGPTFHDVAEFERLAEPTGIIVVENGLYIVRYMVNASVWTMGFLFAGFVEYATRECWKWLPPVRGSLPGVAFPASRRQAIAVATVGGLLHAFVMTWFAARLGVTMTSGFETLLYLFGTVGMWVLAAVPLYLLARHRLVSPMALLTVFVLIDARTEFVASVDDAHALYFGAWFVFLTPVLVAAGLEYGARRLDVLGRANRRFGW